MHSLHEARGAQWGRTFLATLVSMPIFFRCAASSEVSNVLTYLRAPRLAGLHTTPAPQALLLLRRPLLPE